MTAPPVAPANEPWYARPGVVLPIVAALVILAALFAPERVAGRTGDARLSTISTEPQGAALFYDLARRLGWQVEQRRTAVLDTDPDVIHAVLAADVPLRIAEVHALLENVRNGGALLVVLAGAGDPIGDSLHVALGGGGGPLRARGAPTTGCAARTGFFVPLWPNDQVALYSLRWRGLRTPPQIDTFVRVNETTIGRGRARAGAAAVGFPYGRGRIVLGSDPDLLRNDALRVCEYGLDVPAVHMLEYLSDGGAVPRRRIVFDEFHHGFGRQPGTMSAIASYLSGTVSGRLLFQLAAAGLVLLVSLAPRPIPPRDPERVERRSPLEHVDALARAYDQVDATRTATARLVRGVRRRVERGASLAPTAQSDDAFLARAVLAAPALAPDVSLIRTGLTTTLSRADFTRLGTALHRLESSLTRI
jgi:hypothetical protein